MKRMNIDLDLIIDQIAERVAERVEHILKAPAPTELLSVKDTASRIGRTPAAVHQLIARGELPCVRHGRRVHIRVRDLQYWIDRDAV